MLARDFADVKLVDHAPKFRKWGCSEIVATSGFLTAKPGDFEEMLKNMNGKKLEGFHREATRRGHASLLTTPVFYFWVRGSRAMDFYFTSFPFGSYLMFSSRRIAVEEKSLLIPACRDEKLKEKAKVVVEKSLKAYRKILVETRNMDFARRILPIGFSFYGFMELPLQTVLTAWKECENPLVPEELKKISEEMAGFERERAKELFESAELSGLTGYPHPNIFYGQKLRGEEKTEIIKGDLKAVAETFESTKSWRDTSCVAQTEILLKSTKLLSLAAWNDVKRHRTVRMRVETIYDAAESYLKKFSEERIHIPEMPKKLKEFFLENFEEMIHAYEELVSAGEEKSEAVYLIPHALKVRCNLVLDGYHILDPFGMLGIRSCPTADYEVREFAVSLLNFCRSRLPEIAHLLGPKCKIGFCLEKTPCSERVRK